MSKRFLGFGCAAAALSMALSGCGEGSRAGADGTDAGGTASGGASGASGGGPGAGGSASGGAASGGAGADLPPNDATPAPERAGFRLLFEDQFETIDTTRWQTASHTFTENAAQFDADQVTIVDGYLRLGLDKASEPSAEGRLYRGGELRTNEFYGYGRFEARVRFASGSGVVSSIFTYYDHWADPSLEENWNEIDVEFLGKDTSGVQFNVIHWNEANQRTTHEEHATLDFSPSAEFHDYAIEWLPDVVNFYVDEELVHSQTDQIAEFLTLDSRFMMNVWNVQDTPGLVAWAGAFDEASLPTAAYYDWVRIYAYEP